MIDCRFSKRFCGIKTEIFLLNLYLDQVLVESKKLVLVYLMIYIPVRFAGPLVIKLNLNCIPWPVQTVARSV